jgi:uncharacterized RDD family membrane protein YckC
MKRQAAMAEGWYVGRNGEKSGPLSPDQLRRMAATGQLAPGDLVWKQGMADWVQAATIRGLFPQGPAPQAGGAAPPPRPGPGGPGSAPPGRRIGSPPVRPPAPPPGTSSFDLAFENLPGVPGQGETGQPNRFEYESVPEDRSSGGFQAGAGGPVNYATFWQRFAALFLDGIFVGLIGCIPQIGLFAIAFALVQPESEQDTAIAMNVGNILANCVGLVIGCIYYPLLESSEKQATWGKRIIGIRVVTLDGGRISFAQGLGRYLAKIFLSGCGCGIGYLLPWFTEKKQALHDLVAGTLVVQG